MKKIPTLFERVYENHRIVDIKPNVTPGMEWVLRGEGVATVKIDGACCAIIEGELFRRYDCKKGKNPPKGFIPCCEPDEVTGHWPGWVKCDRNNSGDKWFWKAYDCAMTDCLSELKDGTYEAVGEHFQGNPYNKDYDVLIPHGRTEIEVERTFEGIRKYLSENYIEGIVFWKDGQPQCKIKRSDFGFEWKKNK